MLQFGSPVFRAACICESKLGCGAKVAQRTLDPYILVRIQAPQPDLKWFSIKQDGLRT
jgi:hypothetical protein